MILNLHDGLKIKPWKSYEYENMNISEQNAPLTNDGISSMRSGDRHLREISHAALKISLSIIKQSGTKPNLVAKILATNFGAFF